MWKILVHWVMQISLSIDTFHYITSKKSILLISSLISLETPLNIGKPWSSQWQTQIFQIIICVWRPESYRWQQIFASSLSWNDMLALFIFKKIPVKQPSLNNHNFLLVVLWGKMVVHEQNWLVQLTTQTVVAQNAFSWDNQCIPEMLYVYFLSHKSYGFVKGIP